MKKRLLSLALVLVLLLSLAPSGALAAAQDGQVRVIVENTALSVEDGAPWDGTLVDAWVTLTDGSTMMSCITAALATVSATQKGAESNYITEVNGLSNQGGKKSGWMGSLNDWFTSAGFGAYTVKAGTLEAGDEIRLLYTCSWGADLGSDWSSTDKTVQAVDFGDSGAALSPAFDKDTHSYTLTVPAGTTALTVRPTASNKNYQVYTYVGETAYKRSASIPVEAGTVITVKCGDPSWPTMNDDNTGAAQSYTFTVRYATEGLESLELRCLSGTRVGGKLVAREGDTFQFAVYDQNGQRVTENVTWSAQYSGSIDQTGLYTAGALYSGSSSTLYVTATVGELTQQTRFEVLGYAMSAYQKTQTVALSADGQTQKTASISGGVRGYTDWTFTADDGVAALSKEQDKGTWLYLNVYRPGVITARFTLDFDETLTDSGTITVTGVAVEDAAGTQGKTYLTLSAEAAAPTAQLTAYVAEGRTVASWSSGNEAVATVDASGLVTATGVGTALITATDSAGTTGGIKVIVRSADKPYFDALELQTSDLVSGSWTAGKTFAATTTDYTVTLRYYSTSTLTLAATTAYDTEKYTATASYTDASGTAQSVSVASGEKTALPNLPFGATDITVTLADKDNAANKTDYVLHVTRPRDTTKALKSSTGLVLAPTGRSLSSAKYKGYAEGTMFRADETGAATSGTGVTGTQYHYLCYALDAPESFALTVAGSTSYVHLRTSTDGKTWTELPQGGGTTAAIPFGESDTVRVYVQALDDASYVANGGFDGGAPAEYSVWVTRVTASATDGQILTATSDSGDWYPAFSGDRTSYNLVVDGDAGTLPTLTFTIPAGAKAALGSTALTAQDDGSYTLALTTSAQTVTVTSADGNVTNSYSFKALRRSATYDVPDAVVDYLCINSAYTNGGYGLQPEMTLAGSMKSLGNFGGYITYYYETALTDNPNNLYGVDFYVYGNAAKDTTTGTGLSFYEPGQVWVSEDGENWYALAGSAHYDDGVLWDYSVTYTKTSSGKTAWTDSLGNSYDGGTYCGAWPTAANYPMNSAAEDGTVTLSGVALPSSSGKIASVGTADMCYAVNWGYVDAMPNGTALGADVNPYLDNSSHSYTTNGFDLAWAVDAEGNPVDVSGMAFHYVKVQTASNIWHSAFREKSTEVTCVLRATPQTSAVGETALPASVTVGEQTVALTEGQQIYEVSVGAATEAAVTVNGAADDNIYVNNERVAAGAASAALSIPESGARLVRVVVQNGDKEPAIVLLKLVMNISVPRTEAAIDAIGTVTLESGDAIQAARAAYDALSAENQARVTNYETLTAAEAAYAALLNANAVETLIDAIGAVTLESGDAIDAARAAYDALDAGEQAQVANYGTLTAAEAAYTALLHAREVEEQIDAIGTVTLRSGDAIDAARAAYDALDAGEQAQVANYETLTAAEAAYAALSERLADAYRATGDTLAGQTLYAGSSVGGEWAALGLARAGRTVDGDYARALQAYVMENADENGRLNARRSTDNARVILALTALGYNAARFGGVNLAAGLDDLDYLQKQGANGPIWALIALDSGDYSVSLERTALVQAILALRLADGGWNIDETAASSDVDLTAMAVAALAPYYETDEAVRAAVDAALAWLSAAQNATGGFASAEGGGEESCESDAQVLVALTALGIDPLTDARFVKNGSGVLDALLAQYVGGGFRHTASDGESMNQMATEQAYYALCAYMRLTGGESPLYDMTDTAAAPLLFDDVNDGDWFAPAVDALSARGIVSGVDATHFAPQENATRGMVVTFLYRLAGAPTVTGESAFTDVAAGRYYSDAVLWAAQNGIVSGYGDGRFGPEDPVTREQLATILHRYAGGAASSATLDAFSDAADASRYATAHLCWAVEKGILNGYPDGTLCPAANATRAEIVKMLYAYTLLET